MAITPLGAVGWRVGFNKTIDTASKHPYYLYIVYEDDQGDTWQDSYDIGEEFAVHFENDEWVSDIKGLTNGAVVVAVNISGDGSRTSASGQISSNPGYCPDAEPQQLRVGDRATICTKSDNVIVRDEPSRSGSEVLRIPPGTRVEVVGGPECASSSSWWQVEVSSGTWARKGSPTADEFQVRSTVTGWVREGSDAIDKYFVCP